MKSRYGYNSRKKSLHIPLKIIAVLLVIGVCAFAALQTKKLNETDSITAELNSQIAALQQENAELEEKVPAMILENGSFDYHNKYTDMKVDPIPERSADVENAVYLTFDDGPSANTEKILDTLKSYGATATFFVIGGNIAGNEDIVQRIVDEGHTIGIHSYTHDYKTIYASVDSFLDDFYLAYTAVYDACGVYPTMFRFPGGSINSYNSQNYQEIIAEMIRRGFVYHDWSVSSEDSTGKTLTSDEIMNNVLTGVESSSHPIVLMHDGIEKTSTMQAVGSIVSSLQSSGYDCVALTNDVRPITFGYYS